MNTPTRDAGPGPDDTRSLAIVLRGYAPGIFGVSMLVGLAMFGWLSLDAGVYTSQAELRIGDRAAGQARTPLSNVDKEIVAREVRALQSRDLALAAVADLKLDMNAGFQTAPSTSHWSRALNLIFLKADVAPAGETQQERTLRRFTRALRVSAEPDSNRVTVAFSLADRELAARVANRLVELYAAQSRERTRPLIPQDVRWLESEIQNRKRDLDKAEILASHSRTQTDSAAKPQSAKDIAAHEAAAKAKQAHLEKLQASLAAIQARTEALSRPVAVEIAIRAKPAMMVTVPERGMFAGLATGASLIIGLAWAAALELMARAQRSDPQRPSLAPSSITTAPVDVRPGQPSASHASGGDRTRAAMVDITSATFDRPYAPADCIGQFTRCRSIAGVVHRLIVNTQAQGGYRSVIVGEAPGQHVREEATDLAAALCATGKQVALVDWSPDGTGIAKALGIQPTPGFMDLIEERASFDEVIQRLPDGDVHVLPCGSAQSGGNLDTERLNLVLDTLDEVYDHIIVTGTDAAIRVLFLAIGGRFDACVTVGDKRPEGRRIEPETETFLGYHVTDIDLIRLETTSVERVRSPMVVRRDDGHEARARALSGRAEHRQAPC